MIFILSFTAPDGGTFLRIASDESGMMPRVVKLSLETYVAKDLRSFDAKTATWHVAPGACDDFGRRVSFVALTCKAHYIMRDLPPEAVEPPPEEVWEEYIDLKTF